MNRFKAAAIHLCCSFLIALGAALLVFLVWYPGALSYVSGVGKIFIMLVSIDVVLGPFITLIIFNTKKKELKRDLISVVVFQAAALFYGMHTVFVARPVFIVYNSERFDVVYASDLSQDDLSSIKKPGFDTLPLWGPKCVAAPLPEDSKLVEQIILDAVTQGADIQFRPEFYVAYAQEREVASANALPLKNLIERNEKKAQQAERLISRYENKLEAVGYLPLIGKVADGIVVINKKTGDVIEDASLSP